MQFYNYRSVQAIAEYRYPQINKNHPNHNRIAPSRPIASSRIWRDDIWQDPVPVKRKQRSKSQAPDRSRAA